METTEKINTPIMQLIEEITKAVQVCDNDERKWAYQLIIDRAKMLLDEERRHICNAHESASSVWFKYSAKDWAEEYFTRTYKTELP